MFGRLKDGASTARAQAELRRLHAALLPLFPWRMPDTWASELTVVPLLESEVGATRPRLLLLFGAAGLILLIACANVANLMLARAAGREREMALRGALGASSGRLIRQLLSESVLVGALAGLAGLLAAVAYDVFRLPFVFAKEWGIDSIVPPMKLFKVFPRFGAMVLGQPIEQTNYSLTTQIVGWIYHFSNGITFGVMYMALIGDASRRSWWWGVVLAVGLEVAMLATPYTQFFGINMSARFVVVTLTAHLLFGIVLGIYVRKKAFEWITVVRTQ